jgi:uridine phosphorylase
MSRRDFSHANNPIFDCAADVVLLPFGRRSYLPALVDRFDGEEVALDETTDRIAYQLRGASKPLTLVYSGMGSPAAANALEMIAANGGRRVVVFGACGGTDPKVAVGDLIVVSGAVRGEGTSRYYAPPEYPAVFDPVLTARLHEAADGVDVGRHLGVVFTTDAGYRQGPEIYETYAGLVIAVESECAAAAVVGARLGLTMGALLFCSDNVTRSDRNDRLYGGLRNPATRRGFETGATAVVQVLSVEEDVRR